MHLNFHCSGTSNCQDTDPRKSPPTDKILKKCGTYIQGAITQTSNIATEILKLCQWSPQAWTLEENTLRKEGRGRK